MLLTPLKGAIGTSSAFCMPAFGERLGSAAIGVYAADKPDGDIAPAALSPAGSALLAQAKAAYGGPMEIPAIAGFVGGWTLFHNVLPNADLSADSIRAAALKVDVPVGDSINGGGVKFAATGSLDEGQNTRAAAVVEEWAQPRLESAADPPAAAEWARRPRVWESAGEGKAPPPLALRPHPPWKGASARRADGEGGGRPQDRPA